MSETKYNMVIKWGWGDTYRFNETDHSGLFHLDELDAEVHCFLDRIAKRLNPMILSVTLTPYTETIEVPYEKIEQYQSYLEEKGKQL